MSPIIELRGVTRSFGQPMVHALRDVDLSVEHGEFVTVVGPSGSGKSTLLQLIGTLDRPSSGQAVIDGRDVESLNDAQLSGLRAHRIGFVFQQFHLSDGTSALDNVADGLLYSGVPLRARRRRATEALERVKLAARAAHKPSQLSGGERQRVAIARAVVGQPTLLLADEPTGNLDSAAGASVMDLLDELHGSGTTIVMITHDRELAERSPRQIQIKDGRIVKDSGASA
ncbi:ABC transporter ATP-binding protein [Aeromicrobium sp. P5_D10]